MSEREKQQGTLKVQRKAEKHIDYVSTAFN